jgi:hypothetical protein
MNFIEEIITIMLMEFSSFQRLLDIDPTQEEKLAVGRLLDRGATPVNATGYIKAPFVLVDRVRAEYPDIRKRKDIEVLYDPRSHAVWLGFQKKAIPALHLPPPVQVEKVTLTKFINDNDKLVAVIGILLGVAVFSSSSPARPIGQLVIFCIFACALLAWGELLFIYNRTAYPAAGQLQVFMLFFALAFAGSVFYWLIEFSFFRTFAMAAILLQLSKNIFFAKWLDKARSDLRRNFLILLIGVGCLFLGALLNVGLDQINHYLVSHQANEKQNETPSTASPFIKQK